jgi:FkbM family methyltransferase
MKYYSQYQQDFIVDSYFNKKTNGIFVDIGAHDGITLSNTFFLEKYRNWNGICIEPIPEVFEKLKINRKCNLINGAISDSEGQFKFKRCYGYTEMLSGLEGYRDDEHEKRTIDEIRLFGGSFETVIVQGYLMSKILEQHNIFEIDYMSLDIEGGEFEILSSIDFEKYKIKIISVENNYIHERIRNLMKRKGYELMITTGSDDFFERKF